MVLICALGLLGFELRHIRGEDLLAAFANVPRARLLGSVLLVTCGYLAWSLYDVVSLRQIGAKLPYREILRTTACAFPVTNLMGYSLLTGFAIRAKTYSARGLSFSQITQILMFNVESWWVGFIFISGMGMTLSPVAGRALNLPTESARFIGLALIIAVLVYLMACATARGRELTLWRATIHLPDFKGGLLKVLAGATDNLITTLTFFVLLPPSAELNLLTFATLYLGAQLVAVISFVPGGLGVLEGTLLLLLRPYLPDAQILAGLVLFRTMHYLIPVALTAAFFASPRAVLDPRTL